MYCPAFESTRFEAPANVKRVELYAFENSAILESVVLPSVEFVDSYAFENCPSLKSVEAPRLSTVGQNVFYGCRSLTGVDFPSLSAVGYSAFCYCSALESVALKNVKSVDDEAFRGCGMLKEVYMPLLSEMGQKVFDGCQSLENISLPSLTNIPENAFLDCSSLKSADVPKLKTIERSAFSGCSALAEVNAPSAETLRGDAFYNCKALEKAYFPNLKVIEKNAFLSCEQLTEIDLPGLEYIEPYAFNDCGSLRRVSMPNILNMGVPVFDGTPLLEELEISPSNPNYTYEDGVLFNKDKTSIVIYLPGNKNVYYEAPSSVTTVLYGAFYRSEKLRVLNLPSVTKIESCGIQNCPSLRRLIMLQVELLDSRSVYFNNALEEIALSKNVLTIEMNVFQGCEALRDIYYEGSDAAKENIKIYQGNRCLLNAEWHCNYPVSDFGILNVLPDHSDAEAKLTYGKESASLTVAPNGGKISVFLSYGGGSVIKKAPSVEANGFLTFDIEYGNDLEIFIWDENLSPITESYKI